MSKQGISFLLASYFHLKKPSVGKHPRLEGLSGLSAGLRTKSSPVQFPVRAHAWVVGQVSSRECARATNWCFSNTLMFLSLSPSLLLSLKINTYIKSLKKIKLKKKNTVASPSLCKRRDYLASLEEGAEQGFFFMSGSSFTSRSS